MAAYKENPICLPRKEGKSDLLSSMTKIQKERYTHKKIKTRWKVENPTQTTPPPSMGKSLLTTFEI